MTNEPQPDDIQNYKRPLAAGLSTSGEPAPTPVINPDGPTTTIPVPDDSTAPLFSPAEAAAFRARWETIQGSFVDVPHTAVDQADTLVAETMKRLADTFARERANLKGDPDDTVSTENLRLAFCRYRAFFGRLLSV